MTARFVQAIVLTDDLDAEAARLRDAGFEVEPGGRHPGRGTQNVIVPFDGQYLEVLAVVDEAEAVASPAGRPVLAALRRRGPGLARWSVQDDDIEATGSRLGLEVSRRERTLPSGDVIRWRAVGVDEAWDEPWRAAFMRWDDERLHPGHRREPHPNGASGLGTLEVRTAEPAAARRWLGGTDLDDVRIVATAEGAPDLRLEIAVDGGRIVFEPTGWRREA